jgi:hypothetical protein
MTVATSNGAGASANGVSSVSWSHTIGGSDRYLVVAIGYTFSGGSVVSGVTVGGNAATLIARDVFAGSSNFRIDLWGYTAPPTGAQTIQVTFPLTASDVYANSSNYTGVHQSAPLGTPATANGNSAAPSVAVGSAADELVVDGVYHNGTATLTVDGSQTQRWQGDPPANDGTTGHSTEAGAASVTMSWSLSPSAEWAIALVALKPAGAAARVSTLAMMGCG